MARNNSHGKLSKKSVKKTSAKKTTKITTPQIHFDKENDFASIKLAPGIESKSYEKDGFIFSEDKNGKIIEIQILNLSLLADEIKKTA